MTLTPLTPMTIDEFGRQLRAGKTSASEAVEACLRNIAADNPRLNAFILVMADEARGAPRSKPTRNWRRDATADRCTACRFR